jgi:hypothetical protein
MFALLLTSFIVSPLHQSQPKHLKGGQMIEFSGNNCFNSNNNKSSYYRTSGRVEIIESKSITLLFKDEKIMKLNIQKKRDCNV